VDDRVTRTVEVDLSKERMKFSAGHFTIFSSTERENRVLPASVRDGSDVEAVG